MQGWHCSRWGRHRFQHRPGGAPTSTLFDSVAISYIPMKVDKLPQHFGFSPFLAVDAAESWLGYTVGITGRNGMIRTRVVPAQNK